MGISAVGLHLTVGRFINLRIQPHLQASYNLDSELKFESAGRNHSDLNELPKIAKISLQMPKLAKLLETVKLFLFETYNEISGNSDCCPKKSKQKNKKLFNFFFSVAHFGLVEPKSA